MRLFVVINPAAGRSEPILGPLNAAFAGHAWRVGVTHGPGDAHRLTHQAVADGCDVVAAYGGDGTVVEVADALAGGEVPLGVLPGGTSNAFAKALGIPQGLPEAARLLTDPGHTVHPVDTGIINGERFTIGAATGLLASALGETSRSLKERFGFLAYPLDVFRRLATEEAVTYRITLDDEPPFTVEATALYIANAANFGLGGVSLIPQSKADDGLLYVVVFQTSTLNELIAAVATAASLDGLGLPVHAAQHVSITCEAEHTLLADGELIGTTPVEAELHPASLKVITP